MAEPPRVNDKQLSRIKKLIRKLCCNYYKGECLLLYNADPVACVQCSAYTLLCKWFRTAVLPNDAELEAEILGAGVQKRCQLCGKPFLPGSNRARYCEACRKENQRQKTRARVRRYRDAE